MLHYTITLRTLAGLALAVVVTLAASPVLAGGSSRYQVTITNLTRGQIISPPVAVTHRSSFSLFSVGGTPTPGLEALAENGVTDDLVAELEGNPKVLATAVAAGGIMPGQSATLEIKGGRHGTRISVVGMLVTTNDAFFALNGQRLPWWASSSDADVYDAGSEANTESCDDIPGPPCGAPFADPSEESEGFIHIHNGIHGVGDLEPQDSDWRSEAARVVIRRMH